MTDKWVDPHDADLMNQQEEWSRRHRAKPTGTCDWGGCDELAEFWRYDDALMADLPVCVKHMDPDCPSHGEFFEVTPEVEAVVRYAQHLKDEADEVAGKPAESATYPRAEKAEA